ncbi:MAG: phosphopyruvate hydratase [Candidatus Staskawiczbacteria bacterium]|nr:phosphopyruvate hydratase [Candidatus Staskawiczbacteria bacterium]
MPKIKSIRAKEIRDSRNNPTIEVELETEKESFFASVPSGASTGKNEAVALPAEQAIENVNKLIAPKLKGKSLIEQKEIDDFLIKLDGTENKSKLGANAILSVSMAVCRAGAAAQKAGLYEYIARLTEEVRPPRGDITSIKLPLPMFNFIEGGAHTVDRNQLDFQEFMVVPQKKSFAQNMMISNKIFSNLQKIIEKNYGSDIQIGDEGGFAPKISKTEQALLLLENVIGKEDSAIAIDAAASQFLRVSKYILEGSEVSRRGLLDFYKDLTKRFNIISIEDPFAEEDFEGFKELLNELPNLTIVGDDLTTTNVKKIKEAYSKKACNGVVIKPNQIGTVSEAIKASNLAKSYGWRVVVSHRSGETMDDFISDFAVGVGADFIKSGSPSQPERMVKYDRLLQIEDELRKKHG